MKTIKQIRYESSDFALAHKIRVEVFVEEQRCPIELELDDHDQTALHLLVFDGGLPVGCGRLLTFPEYSQIGRVAVLKEKRGEGFGRLICEKLLEIAVKNGAKKVILHAQCQAVKFYEQLGFVAEGEIFDDCGIDHISMVKII